MWDNRINIPGNFTNQITPRTVFNLKEFIANKATILLWGNGDLLSSQNEGIKKAWSEITDNNYWEQTRAKIERLCSSVGKVYVTIDIDNGNNARWTIAEPSFYNQMSRIFNTSQSAVIYKRITHDNYNYIVRELWDTEKVTRQMFNATKEGNLSELSLNEVNTKLPKDLRVKEVWFHDAGFLPVVEFINKPIQPVYGAYNNYFYPDDYLCYGLQIVLDNLFNTMEKETSFNRTRILGNLTPQEMLKIKNDPTHELSNKINDFWLSTNALRNAGNQGIQGALQVLQGDPKLKTYADQVQFIIDKYTEGCGYSPLMTSIAQKTEAETLFTKSLDNETTTFKREIRTKQIYRLIDKTFALLGIQKIDEPREYEYSMNSNLSIDKLKEAETLAFKVENNFMSTAEAIAEIRNIDIEEAKKISEEIFRKNMERNNIQMALNDPFKQEEDKEDTNTLANINKES